MMAEINVTPLVDVMLVLLVIFMVTAPMMAVGLDVRLPAADAPPLPPSDQQLVLTVSADGGYAIADRSFTLDEIRKRMAALAQVAPDRQVFVKADAQVPYERVAALISAVQAAGIRRVGLVTRPAGTP